MIHKKLLKLETELNGCFLEREEIVRGLLVTAVAKGNLLILGAPGAAKTAIAEALSKQLGGKFFSRLLTKVSAPEELFGPLSLKALENDQYKRVTAGKLPEADVVVIDEVFKCNSAVLNTLLPIMNERVYFDDSSTPKPIPLQVLVGLSNELPDGGVNGELAALWDRFDLKYTVDYVKDERNFATMLKLSTNTPSTVISLQELQSAQQQAEQVNISDDTINALVRLWKELKSQGFIISDRRFRNCLRFLKAHAWLEGRVQVVENDIVILSNMLWTEPDQIKQTKKIVMGFANPLTVKANEIFDGAFELSAKLKETPDGTERTALAAEANHKFKVAQKMLDGLLKQAKNEGKATAKIVERLAQLKEMNENVVNTYLLGL
ncbi:AAA family ATPase [Anaerosinus sp.]|uniref:AAA family ATPase n=1 Tax=Selenobaculum sp. TaxID=3074374 RepID=UPI003AB32BAC